MGCCVASNTDNEGGAHTLLSVLRHHRHPMNGGSSINIHVVEDVNPFETAYNSHKTE